MSLVGYKYCVCGEGPSQRYQTCTSNRSHKMSRFTTYIVMLVVVTISVALVDSLSPIPPPTPRPCKFYCDDENGYHCCDGVKPDKRCSRPNKSPVFRYPPCLPGVHCPRVPKECGGPYEYDCRPDEFCCYYGSESSTNYVCFR
ncbi:uncharacterized protein LOC143027542 [Oratosquilla oratoria]|uniref:uncharacterized protein LOC143027542 n=1 Tax=Oratosquilla oratoria TaxID=337810 RepID=UPI003F76F907